MQGSLLIGQLFIEVPAAIQTKAGNDEIDSISDDEGEENEVNDTAKSARIDVTSSLVELSTNCDEEDVDPNASDYLEDE